MTPSLLACAALVVTGTTLATELPDPPPPPPPPPATARPSLPPPPPPPPVPRSPVETGLGLGGRALHRLDLTPEQRQRVRALLGEYREQGLGEAMDAAREAHHAVERKVWDAEATETDLSAARAAMAEAEERLTAIRHRLALEILEVLDEEQRTTFGRALDDPHWGSSRP